MISKRRIKFRQDRIRLALSLVVLGMFVMLLARTSHAGDSHEQGQAHKVTYFILDVNGQTVSGQNPGLAFERASDGLYLDFDDGTFKSSGWGRRIVSMEYNFTDRYYFKIVSTDSTNPLISGDYIVIVSNDDATYRDRQSESISFGNTNKLILINS